MDADRPMCSRPDALGMHTGSCLGFVHWILWMQSSLGTGPLPHLNIRLTYPKTNCPKPCCCWPRHEDEAACIVARSMDGYGISETYHVYVPCSPTEVKKLELHMIDILKLMDQVPLVSGLNGQKMTLLELQWSNQVEARRSRRLQT